MKACANVRVLEYDMGGFFRSCVDTHLELASGNVRPLGRVDTPFLAEDPGVQPGEAPETGAASAASQPEC